MEQLLKDSGSPCGTELLGEVHPLLQQLGCCDGLVTVADVWEFAAGQQVRDGDSLRRFLDGYQQEILLRYELPAIFRGARHAQRNQFRELLALDAEIARWEVPSQFVSASRRVGQGNLQRLRPLRDQRLVKRYLQAVDRKQAHGWHTIVYGITLTVYSLPVRQGLIGYARQTLDGFVRAMARPLHLTAQDCRQLLEELSQAVPPRVENVIKSQHS